MPILTNKVTGKKYSASKEQIEAVRNNPSMKNLYDIGAVEEPAEVTQLRQTEAIAQASEALTADGTAAQGKGRKRKNSQS